MPPQTIYGLEIVDFDRPVFTIDEIRKVNPQRFEMEQLTAILHVDREGNGLIGYKDITPNEFWVRGHMPEFPLMPGVVLCECAAQLARFYARKYELLEGDFLGFGGMAVRSRRLDRFVEQQQRFSAIDRTNRLFVFTGILCQVKQTEPAGRH